MWHCLLVWSVRRHSAGRLRGDRGALAGRLPRLAPLARFCHLQCVCAPRDSGADTWKPAAMCSAVRGVMDPGAAQR